jgi:hypothetical protein
MQRTCFFCDACTNNLQRTYVFLRLVSIEPDARPRSWRNSPGWVVDQHTGRAAISYVPYLRAGPRECRAVGTRDQPNMAQNYLTCVVVVFQHDLLCCCAPYKLHYSLHYGIRQRLPFHITVLTQLCLVR